MARKTPAKHPHVMNWNDAAETTHSDSRDFGGRERWLTPSMPREKGHIGVNRVVLSPGQTYCPFHWHVKEDEVFLVLEGAGLLRYGDWVIDIGAGDCIACPRNSGEGHQIANVSDRDLVYISIGENSADEVCVYPDTGKLNVRSLRRIVQPTDVGYFDGEPSPPRILGADRPAPAAASRAQSRAKSPSPRGRR